MRFLLQLSQGSLEIFERGLLVLLGRFPFPFLQFAFGLLLIFDGLL
ncbi:hypothetical protein NA78x_003972 [Anatilimnocola sp. NA78]